MHRSSKRAARLLTVAALTIAVAHAEPARTDGDNTPFTNLIALVSQRLALAEPVARYKWARHETIIDTPRENALLAQVESKAKSAQVDPDFARQFSAIRSMPARTCRTPCSRTGAQRRRRPTVRRPISRRTRVRSSIV